MLSAAKFKAISSDKFAILLTLTPSAGFNSYLVIVGPTDTFSTFAATPKLCNVLCNLLAVSVIAFLLFLAVAFPSFKYSNGGNS